MGEDERPTSRAGLNAFIPLSEDTTHALSTRGQRLPSIIGNSRSTASLFSLPGRDVRRRSSFMIENYTDDEESNWDTATQIRTQRLTSLSRDDQDPRRSGLGPEILQTPQMRSMRLIGNSNPRYKWHQYYKTNEELKPMKKSLRGYYERNNYLIAQYMYIDRLLDSSLPHDLIGEYEQTDSLPIIEEEESHSGTTTPITGEQNGTADRQDSVSKHPGQIKRTPRNLYKVPDERSPLLAAQAHPDDEEEQEQEEIPDIGYDYEADEGLDSSSPIVAWAIYVNLTANVILLAAKTAVIVLTSSLSVLASLVDAALDFLSTAIVWTTTFLIARQDQYAYPVGRRRLEPVGVLVFSVIMITSFFQVGLQCFQRLLSDDHTVVELGLPAIIIMVGTVVIKGGCWFWCRLVKNSSVQALAQDAMTDVVFNTFSIIFPLVGFYVNIWWLDALGGLLLSLYVMVNWAKTSSEHVRNLCGAAASADERNILLYLTMRFAKTIRYIQGLQAYHAGDQLNVEVDIVLDENTNLKDSHDVAESLQYVLESVPMVDRAFVHTDYKRVNLPSHMNQQASD